MILFGKNIIFIYTHKQPNTSIYIDCFSHEYCDLRAFHTST